MPASHRMVRVQKFLYTFRPSPELNSQSSFRYRNGLDLPHTVKVIATRASKGSLKDLHKLSQYLHVNHFLARHPEPLRIFLHFLTVKPPRHHADAGDNHTVYLAAASLKGIMKVIGLNCPTDNSPVAREFLNSWPAVWRWMQYLYFHPNPAEIQTCGPSFTTNIIGITIVRIISDLLFWSSSATTQVIMSTKGVFQMVMKIFTEFAQTQSVGQDRLKNYGVVTHVLSKFFHYDSARYVQELVDIYGGLTQLASILLQNIGLTIKGDMESMAAYSVLSCLHSEIENNVPGLAHALLLQNGMVDVCRALALHSSMSFPQTPSQLHVSIYSSLLYFIRAANTSDGSMWIVQAIRSGFILSMLRSSASPFTEDPLNIQQIIEIIRIFRTYLVYRSVLRALGRALKNPAIPLLESRMSENILQAWVHFRKCATGFLAFKWAFDRTIKYSRSCTAYHCDRAETSHLFWRCSVCLAPYCSASCQEHDWKQGDHRLICRAATKDRLDRAPISPLDYAFLTLLADGYLDGHLEVIRRQGKDLLRLQDNEQPTVYIDYVTERLLVVDRSTLSRLVPSGLPPYYGRDTMQTSARVLLGIRVGAQTIFLWVQPSLAIDLFR